MAGSFYLFPHWRELYGRLLARFQISSTAHTLHNASYDGRRAQVSREPHTLLMLRPKVGKFRDPLMLVWSKSDGKRPI